MNMNIKRGGGKARKNPAFTPRDLCLAAMMTALVFVLTYTIKIPTPGMGYIHPGDGFVILSGLLLGPGVGFVTSALGSALADIVGGYFVFAPATFVIKGLEALLAYYIFHTLMKIWPNVKRRSFLLALIPASICGAAFMVLGYFLYETLIFGQAVALASLVSNLVQGGVSVVFSAVLYYPLSLIVRPEEHRRRTMVSQIGNSGQSHQN